MIRKFFFIAFIVLFSLFISALLEYNDQVILYFSNYRIITTSGFLVFLLMSFALTLYLIIYLFVSLLSSSKKKHKKNNNIFEKKIQKYLDLITEGFIYKNTNNIKESLHKLQIANKMFPNFNIAKLLESQIYYMQKDYKKSEEVFLKIQNINLNMNLLNLKIKLNEAIKNSDVLTMKNIALEILKIEPINKTSIEVLFKIYNQDKDWENAYSILKIGLKAKIFNEIKKKNSILFIYSALGKKYYDNRLFSNAKTILREAYKLDFKYIPSTNLLILTYLALNKKSKALRILKKAWKHCPYFSLLKIYLEILNTTFSKIKIKDADILYKINSRSFESNFILAQAYFNAEIYLKARKYAKIAESIEEEKELYELMLKIEQADGGSSTIISNLKNKILNSKNKCWQCQLCKREYINWQPECTNCHSLNNIMPTN